MLVISVERLVLYLRAYDERYGYYPESDYEGEAIENWLTECMEGDKKLFINVH
jgi:hypothetical protein